MNALDAAVCAGALFGFFLMVVALGSWGNSNIYRGIMLVYCLALTSGYAAQYWWEHKEPDFMGFPLMGVFCWGIIGVFQILHIRLNYARQKREQEDETRNLRF